VLLQTKEYRGNLTRLVPARTRAWAVARCGHSAVYNNMRKQMLQRDMTRAVELGRYGLGAPRMPSPAW
jgi:hypothetical protein